MSVRVRWALELLALLIVLGCEIDYRHTVHLRIGRKPPEPPPACVGAEQC